MPILLRMLYRELLLAHMPDAAEKREEEGDMHG